MAEGNICDDDITLQYTEIIKANNHLADKTLSETKQRSYIQTLKFRIKTLMNNNQGKAKHTANHRPIRCIWSRLSGKEGQVRSNMLGKRGDQAGRSVIGPGPELRTNEVGIPYEMAQTLTIPEIVTEFNKDYLTNLINEGKANFVVKKDKVTGKERKIDLKYALFRQGTDLLYGDIIHRRGNNGDELKIFVKDRTKISLQEGDKVERNGKF
jgi:DNA-directed RNA polymerase beta' subunit